MCALCRECCLTATFSTHCTHLANRLSSITTATTGQTTIGSGTQLDLRPRPHGHWDRLSDNIVKGKVDNTQAMKPQRRSTVIAPLITNHGTRWR